MALDLKMFKTGHSCSVSLNTHMIQWMVFPPHQIHYPWAQGPQQEASPRGYSLEVWLEHSFLLLVVSDGRLVRWAPLC